MWVSIFTSHLEFAQGGRRLLSSICSGLEGWVDLNRAQVVKHCPSGRWPRGVRILGKLAMDDVGRPEHEVWREMGRSMGPGSRSPLS